MSDPPEEIDGEGGVGGDLSNIGDTVVDLITGVPAPIRKNAAKAFTRLCTALVEYPLAMIEGAVAEKRALTRARVRLIDASASQIAEQMRTDPEYIRAAASKFAHKIIRERVNIDQVSEIAAAELKSEPLATMQDTETEAPPISDDWLNAFENEASQMSSAQMQLLFGKILAGEIRRPQSFSIKTIKLMGQLDNQAATLFRILCSLSISLRIPVFGIVVDARVTALGGSAASNSLQSYGLTFDNLNVLKEYGLIISDYSSWVDYQLTVVRNGQIAMPLTYQKVPWALVPKSVDPAPGPSNLHVHGVGFSRSGKELLSIVDIEPNDQYTAALKDFFDKSGMTLTPIG
jgi:hypothetical protein